MSGQKYALLILPIEVSRNDGRRQFDSATETFIARLPELVDPAELRHWKEWWGSVQWAEVEKSHRMVLTCGESSRPDVLDAENVALTDRLYSVWQALPLASPLHGSWGISWMLTGEATADRKLKSIREVSRLNELVRPFYKTRKSFWSKLPRGIPDPWLDRWIEIEGLLRNYAAASALPDILAIGLKAFASGLGRDDLEFRIPDLVRAAECILAIPKGPGAKVFAARAMQVAPALVNNWFASGPDLDTKLIELYQHRNDCVHGKVPFRSLLARGEAGADDAARLEYLAEAIAREVLVHALRSPGKHTEFHDRDRLEDAWKAGRLP